MQAHFGPSNKLKLLKILHAVQLYTVINLELQLNCCGACNATQRQRCWRWRRLHCSKRARNFRNFLIAANALHKCGGRQEGGTVLKGLLLKWKTSQTHISRTTGRERELHKSSVLFFFVFNLAGSAFDAILWSAFMAAALREGTRIALSLSLSTAGPHTNYTHTHELLD